MVQAGIVFAKYLQVAQFLPIHYKLETTYYT